MPVAKPTPIISTEYVDVGPESLKAWAAVMGWSNLGQRISEIDDKLFRLASNNGKVPPLNVYGWVTSNYGETDEDGRAIVSEISWWIKKKDNLGSLASRKKYWNSSRDVYDWCLTNVIGFPQA